VNNNYRTKEFLLPQVLTGSRIAFAIGMFVLILFNQHVIAFILLLVSSFTDIIDGIVARKLEVTSTFGAYFDACADFSLVLINFIALVLIQIYPYWLIILICFMFFQFLLTSNKLELFYDPIGKYLGTIHLLIIGATLLFAYFYPDALIFLILLIILVTFNVISLSSRIISFYKSSRKKGEEFKK